MLFINAIINSNSIFINFNHSQLFAIRAYDIWSFLIWLNRTFNISQITTENQTIYYYPALENKSEIISILNEEITKKNKIEKIIEILKKDLKSDEKIKKLFI